MKPWIQWIVGNVTFMGQVPAAVFCLTDGGCAAVDAAYCINPAAKPLFAVGSAANLCAGGCFLGAIATGVICPPACLALAVAGTSCRKVGKYTIKAANTIDPTPTTTKLTAPIGEVVDAIT